MHKYPRLFRFVLVVWTLGAAAGSLLAVRYSKSAFSPNGFPRPVSNRVFSIPLDPAELLVVYPKALEPDVKRMAALLTARCGRDIPFRAEESLKAAELAAKHAVLLGNISCNRWVLELYKQRYAFADAIFPGKGGVIIHPAVSLWNREKHILVVGASSEADLLPGFERFVGLLPQNASRVEAIHYLKSSVKLPPAPTSVADILDGPRKDLWTAIPAYETIGGWGLNYCLTGDKKWAEHFREGFYLLYERAERSGQWVPELWTGLYFGLRSLFMGWELIGDDPFFSARDRKIIEEVLWGYTDFVRHMILLDPTVAPAGEPRQNHTAHMGLGLYYAYRYYTRKYGMTDLEPMADQFRLAFDFGQANSYRPNDDAAGYQLAGPGDYLAYAMGVGDDSFLKIGRLRQYIDLLVTTTDNRGDVVGFGDTGAYTPHAKGGGSGLPHFARLAAWYYGEGQYQWLANWLAQENDPGNLSNGDYAVNIKDEMPTRYAGIFPVLLDEASLLFASRRAERKSWLREPGKTYFDKISLRRNFDPEDEYLCLEGTSFFSHGHFDGNTVTRLTWKDRIWLFDLNYINYTPRYHNGVVVTFDGKQGDPPLLNSLDCRADFGGVGILRTTARDFNRADWERTIVWRKGRYFLFLDRVTAQEDGNYRLDCRWRTRGDISLAGNDLEVRQGDKTFAIKSADGAPRRLVYEPDGYRNTWDYPYGDGRIGVCLARKEISMARNTDWTFVNLMYAADGRDRVVREVSRPGDGLFLVRDGDARELIGLRPGVLTKAGIFTDAGLFFYSDAGLCLTDAAYLSWPGVSLSASARIHLQIDLRSGTGSLEVPAGGRAVIQTRGLSIAGAGQEPPTLEPGVYRVAFKAVLRTGPDPIWASLAPGQAVLPEPWAGPLPNAGAAEIETFQAEDALTSVAPSPNGLLAGDKMGRIRQFSGGKTAALFQIASGRPVVALQLADIDGDGSAEVVAGDDHAALFCYELSGKLIWRYDMTPTNGSAVAADIAIGDIDGQGKPTILVATKSWKLYAFNPDGSVRWEGFLYYHPCTRVKILRQDDGQTLIAVGNVYHTPLNVVSPADGTSLWHTWEQCGGEAYSTTDYCGFHLTDMVFVDADGDGKKEIVFGNKHNGVCALAAADGATAWTATVGDEVTVLEKMRDPGSGEECILVGTDAGDLVKLDRRGRRVAFLTLPDGVSDLAVLEYPDKKRNDIIVSTRDAGVVICDQDLRIRASAAAGPGLTAVFPAGKAGEANLFYAVSDRAVHLLKSQPFFLRPSRMY